MALKQADAWPHQVPVWPMWERCTDLGMAFDQKAPDTYVDLFSCKTEVMNKLKTKAYELNEEDKVPIKKLVRKGGTTLNTNIHKF